MTTHRMTPLTQSFPKNLLRERTSRRLTQDQMATLLAVAPSYVSMLETGQRTPSLDMIDLFARRLRVPPVSLVEP